MSRWDAAASRQRAVTTRAWLDAIKQRRGCADCGTRAHLEFDHRNPLKKLFAIGQSPRRPLSELRAEVRKCDVRCSHCHDKRHAPERSQAAKANAAKMTAEERRERSSKAARARWGKKKP